MREEIKSSQAEMRSTVCATRSELKETIQHEIKAVMQPNSVRIGWDDRLQRSDRDWTQSRNDAVDRGASRYPKGRGRSDAGWRTNVAA
jgi:hypothetical protein